MCLRLRGLHIRALWVLYLSTCSICYTRRHLDSHAVMRRQICAGPEPDYLQSAGAAGPAAAHLHQVRMRCVFIVCCMIERTPTIRGVKTHVQIMCMCICSVPFASLIVFFAIYGGIIGKRDYWSRYVRFNAMQVRIFSLGLVAMSIWIVPRRLELSLGFSALGSSTRMWRIAQPCHRKSSSWLYYATQAILLDIILILPGVIENVIKPPVGNSFGLTLYINGYNT